MPEAWISAGRARWSKVCSDRAVDCSILSNLRITMVASTKIVVDLDPEGTDDPIATLRVQTPQGVIFVMAEVSGSGRTLTLMNAHLHSDTGPNAFGPGRLRASQEH